MSTIKQRTAAQLMVVNGGNASKAMRDAGYSPNTAKTPSKLTSTTSFKHLMDEYGLTDELLLTSLADDIAKKPGNRKAELELAFKLKGYFNTLSYADSTTTYPIAIVEFV